jgi:hypothetical protein
MFLERSGNGLALVEPQRLERQARVPQVNLGHGLCRLGKRPGGAVIGSEVNAAPAAP